MASTIPITGLGSDDVVPGSLVEVNFAQGVAPTGTSALTILLMGNKTSSGSAIADTVIYGPDTQVTLASQLDANTLFGARSELARMYKRVAKVNPNATVYAVCVAESAGAAATGTVTLTTTATAAGTLRIYVGDEFVDTPISSGDTPSVIAASAVININAKADWPLTASAVGGVITLTAAQKGPRGNWLRYSARIVGAGVGTTVTPTAQSFCTGGTTADVWTTALSTIQARKFAYIAPAAEDATTLSASTGLMYQVNNQALPTTGIRQRVVAGSVDSLSNVTTISQGLNSPRCEIWWCAQLDVPPAEIAAHGAAVITALESGAYPRLNFNGVGNDPTTQALWPIKSPISGAAPTRAQLKAALGSGVTPIGVNQNGSTYLVKRVTSKSLNGASPDYRVRDAHKVTVCDRFGDDLQAKLASQCSGKVIGTDPLPGQKVPGPTVATPSFVASIAKRLVTEYGNNDMLQSVDTIIAGTYANRETSPTTRINVKVPLNVADILDQANGSIDQVASF